jgi:hypothetical protein
VDRRLADHLALRADDEQAGAVRVAALGTGGVDQAVDGAVRLTDRRHDPAELVPGCDPGALVVAHLRARLRDPVAEPGEDRQRQQRADEAHHDEERQEGDQGTPIGDDELGQELQEGRPSLLDLIDDRHGAHSSAGRPPSGRTAIAPGEG